MCRSKQDLSEPTLETEAQTILACAQRILLECGKVVAHALVPKRLAEGQVQLIHIVLPSDKEKWKPFLTEVLRKLGAERYFLVDEVWVCTADNWDATKRVSENITKFEALSVFAVTRDGERVYLCQQFLRDPSGIKLLEVSTSRECVSNLTPESW
jgi:hypothetical protein